MNNCVICFDLDDTLFKEIDYLKSAYGEIATLVGKPEAAGQMVMWYKSGENAFKKLIDTYNLTISINDLVKIYREHYPDICLEEGAHDFLLAMKRDGWKLGLISDGRSLTQRNKIRALGIQNIFDIVIISEEFGSEKPCLKNYRAIMDRFPDREVFIYVGDNMSKDFIAPNQLGWKTICIKDNGRNIHKQDFTLSDDYMPQYIVDSFQEINRVL